MNIFCKPFVFMKSVNDGVHEQCITRISFIKNILFFSEPRKEIEIATYKLPTMFLFFPKSDPRRS